MRGLLSQTTEVSVWSLVYTTYTSSLKVREQDLGKLLHVHTTAQYRRKDRIHSVAILWIILLTVALTALSEGQVCSKHLTCAISLDPHVPSSINPVS